MYSIWVGPEKGFMHLSILQMKRRGVLDPRPDNRVNGVSCYHPRRCPQLSVSWSLQGEIFFRIL